MPRRNDPYDNRPYWERAAHDARDGGRNGYDRPPPPAGPAQGYDSYDRGYNYDRRDYPRGGDYGPRRDDRNQPPRDQPPRDQRYDDYYNRRQDPYYRDNNNNGYDRRAPPPKPYDYDRPRGGGDARPPSGGDYYDRRPQNYSESGSQAATAGYSDRGRADSYSSLPPSDTRQAGAVAIPMLSPKKPLHPAGPDYGRRQPPHDYRGPPPDPYGGDRRGGRPYHRPPQDSYNSRPYDAPPRQGGPYGYGQNDTSNVHSAAQPSDDWGAPQSPNQRPKKKQMGDVTPSLVPKPKSQSKRKQSYINMMMGDL